MQREKLTIINRNGSPHPTLLLRISPALHNPSRLVICGLYAQSAPSIETTQRGVYRWCTAYRQRAAAALGDDFDRYRLPKQNCSTAV